MSSRPPQPDLESRPRTETEVDPFRPVNWLPGRHLQTIVPSLWPAPRVAGDAEHRIVPVARGSSVRLDVNRPAADPSATLLLVHGMCGSSESGYMRRTARLGLESGWVTARMNLRNCGGTERLASTLYNAGQSDDVARVLTHLGDHGFPRPFLVAGFSLGGNIVLRYAAVAGAGSQADAVAAVNPPVDLDACARAIERPANRVYQSHYVRRLCRQLRRIRKVRGGPSPRPRARRLGSVRAFDAIYTAPDAGFASAEEYYETASAGPLLPGNRTPALVLSAANDPFVPIGMFRPYHDLPGIDFVHPAAGGHCGYWQRGRPRFWAGEAIRDFFRTL